MNIYETQKSYLLNIIIYYLNYLDIINYNIILLLKNKTNKNNFI